MAFWPVIHHDGSFRATDEQGQTHLITMGGEPVRSLNPGWSPLGLETGLAPLHLLELRHEEPSEPDAVWYLDEHLRFLANHPGRLPTEAAEQAIGRLLPLLRDIHETTLCGPRPEPSASARHFHGINPAFVAELLTFVAEQALTPPDCVSVDRFSGLSDHYMTNGLRLSLPKLRALLAAPLDSVAALDPLEVASPLGGGALRAQESLRLPAPPGEPPLGAHRFFDRAAGLSFYLIVTRREVQQAYLFIPGLNLAFTRGEPSLGLALLAGLLAHESTRAADPTRGGGPSSSSHPGHLPRVPPAERRRWKILSGSGAA